jgi:heptosyltransferase II
MKKLHFLKDFSKIAIIQTAFPGDTVLALYLACLIKEVSDNIEITFVATPVGASIAKCCTLIDRVISYDKSGLHSGIKGIRFIANELKTAKIECILAPHRSARTSLITYFSKPVFSVSFDKSSLSFLYSRRVKYILAKHEIERNQDLLSVFQDSEDFRYKEVAVNLKFFEDDKNYIDNILISKDVRDYDKLVAIAPGSVWATKRWLPEYYKELCIFLSNNDIIPVLIGSEDDIDISNEIEKGVKVINITGLTNIPQSIYLISKCGLTISNDSAPTHFAGLVNCPTITIFGATSSEFGFYPRGIKDKSIGLEGLKCRPCSIHGSDRCPLGTFDCMKLLTPDKVIDEVKAILQNDGRNSE